MGGPLGTYALFGLTAYLCALLALGRHARSSAWAAWPWGRRRNASEGAEGDFRACTHGVGGARDGDAQACQQMSLTW